MGLALLILQLNLRKLQIVNLVSCPFGKFYPISIDRINKVAKLRIPKCNLLIQYKNRKFNHLLRSLIQYMFILM